MEISVSFSLHLKPHHSTDTSTSTPHLLFAKAHSAEPRLTLPATFHHPHTLSVASQEGGIHGRPSCRSHLPSSPKQHRLRVKGSPTRTCKSIHLTVISLSHGGGGGEATGWFWLPLLVLLEVLGNCCTNSPSPPAINSHKAKVIFRLITVFAGCELI